MDTCANSVTVALHGNLYRHFQHLSQLICSQHRDAEPLPPDHASAVCDTETSPPDVQTTSPGSCRERPFALNEVVDFRLSLEAICSVVVIPSLLCATSSSELNEISPHSLLETRTILLDIPLRRAICADLDNLQDATCVVRHVEMLNVVTRLEVESSKHTALPWISCVCMPSEQESQRTHSPTLLRSVRTGSERSSLRLSSPDCPRSRPP